MQNRVFLMLILENPTYEVAKKLQKEVNEKYKLYEVLPTPHITLESIFTKSEEDFKAIIPILRKICRKVKPFPVFVRDFACFGPPYKSVQLKVEPTEPLMYLYKEVHDKLKYSGFQVREYPEGIEFHITIASTCFAEREWTLEEYGEACRDLKNHSIVSGYMLKRLELWHPELDEGRRIAEIFYLKN